MTISKPKHFMVRETGIEPVRPHRAQDFKSCASACSATRAWSVIFDYEDYTTIYNYDCQQLFK